MPCFAANNAVMYNRRMEISVTAPRVNEMFSETRPRKPDERAAENQLSALQSRDRK